MDVHVNKLKKSFGETEVLHDIELNFESGDSMPSWAPRDAVKQLFCGP